jgi:Outer membrane cobalamin receptor protein
METPRIISLVSVVIFLIGSQGAVAQDRPKDKRSEQRDSTVSEGKPRILAEVQVSAGTFEASDKAKGASLTPIDAVTVAGSNNDLSQALRALPGAQQIGEREGLFVRGGTGEETKQFIDGILVKNPNYPSVPGIPQYARIDPFLFKGILFSTGGYSALYGQAMSSALILESIDIPEATEASFSIFPANTGLGFQRRANDGNSGYGINLAYSNHRLYNAIVPQGPEYFAGPSYLQGDAHFRIKTNERGILKFYTNWNGSEVGLTQPDVDDPDRRSAYFVRGRNTYNNLNLVRYFGNNWKMDVSAGYSFLRTSIRSDQAGHSDRDEHFAQLRTVFSKGFARNQAIRFGAEHFFTRETGTWEDRPIRFTDQLTSAFAEGDVYLTTRLGAKVGGRVEHSSALQRWAFAPRVSLGYRLGPDGQLNAAYGIFYQAPSSIYLYDHPELGFSRAAHYLVNYTYNGGNRFFRAEAYYKRYDGLLRTEPILATSGAGDAKGLEFFFRDKRTFANLDYWITYTYIDTKRQFLDYPALLKPTFAAPHTGTLAVKKYFPALSTNINVSYTFASGRPFYDIVPSPGPESSSIRHAGTTRPYSVVNLHVAYLTSFFKRSKLKNFSGIGMGVNNLLGTKQVFGYQYSTGGQYRQAITLPAPRYYYIGVFMNWGVDRRDDFMDNQLL